MEINDSSTRTLLNGTILFDNKNSPKQVSEDGWFWILLGVIGVVALVANSGVIFLIATRRRLRTACNSFILSLTLSDLLAGAVAIPGSFICHFSLGCNVRVWFILCNFFICASVGNVCTLVADRFFRVLYPLRYPVLMSSRRVANLILLGWTVPIFLQLIPSLVIQLNPALNRRVFSVVQMFTFAILPCMGLLLAFAKICAITIKHSRHHRVQVEQVYRTSSSSVQLKVNLKLKTRKSFSVIVLGVVIFFFVFCWSFTIYRGICDSFALCKVHPPVILASRIFLASNMAVDPVVYAILKQDVRQELVSTILAIAGHKTRIRDIRMSQTRTWLGQSRK